MCMQCSGSGAKGGRTIDSNAIPREALRGPSPQIMGGGTRAPDDLGRGQGTPRRDEAGRIAVGGGVVVPSFTEKSLGIV